MLIDFKYMAELPQLADVFDLCAQCSHFWIPGCVALLGQYYLSFAERV